MQIIDGHILKEVEKTDLINGTFHIPANVDTIERYAFIHSQISYIEIPQHVEIIKAQAFTECNNLKRVIFLNQTCEIGMFAFSQCQELEYIELPQNLKGLPIGIFNYCRKLREIWIPDTVKEIEEMHFLGDPVLRKIHYKNHTYTYKDLKTYNIFT